MNRLISKVFWGLKRYLIILFSVLIILNSSSLSGQINHFITCSGSKLMEGNGEFRFISFNIPSLHYIEDEMTYEKTVPFRFPDDFEIRDVLESVGQMGGTVVRTYVLSVRKPEDPTSVPHHVLGPGEFNEEAFTALDRVLKIANETGIRLIIPFVNNFGWWGGAKEYAAFREKEYEDFWEDPQLIDDFKKTVFFIINRVNTITGVPYKEDKSILAWETGNGTHCPHSWTSEIAAYIKNLDSNHLVIDGYHTEILRKETIEDPNIDFVKTHHYENDPREMINHIRENAAMVRGKKPYHIGEFGFISTEAVGAVLNTVIEESLSGALIWSLRGHHRNGGFFWHSEPAVKGRFKAYHWPGFHSGILYDEAKVLRLFRDKAFEIRGLETPSIEKPKAPALLPFRNVSSITWQGSSGASSYDVFRANSFNGPWIRVGNDIDDSEVQYRPLFNDYSAQPGKSYYYRVIAKNLGGESEPSNVVGPIKVLYRTLIDEFQNDARIYFQEGTVLLRSFEARRFKEDTHRIGGRPGSSIIYKVPGSIRSWKVFTFSSEDSRSFEFAVSINGSKFNKVTPAATVYFTREGNYGYWKPVLYSAEHLSGKTEYLRIKFKDSSQISRIEIQYE